MITAASRLGRSAALCGALAALLDPAAIGAQSSQHADSLLAAGNLAGAESAYYAATRATPRDATARWALGRFLLQRGATRVGATLLEESLQFGGNPVLVGRDLVGAYLQMADFAPLVSLAAAPPAQRERARWLSTHEPRVVAPDSVITVAIATSGAPESLGSIPIRINGVALLVAVTSGPRGIFVSRSALGNHRLRLFAAGADTTADADMLAVADSVSVGSITLLNQPVIATNLPAGTQARIGLSDLGRFAPATASGSATLTLSVDGSVHGQAAGDPLPTLDRASGIAVLRGGAWLVAPAEVASLLRNGGWTFDARRGTLIVER